MLQGIELRIQPNGKLHAKTASKLRRRTSISSHARTVKTWAPRLREAGYVPIVIPHEDQDLRLVDVDAPRSKLGVSVEVMLGWARSDQLPHHRIRKGGKAPRVHRGRRFALRSDVVSLRDGDDLDPPVRPLPTRSRGVYVIELDACGQADRRGTCVYVGESARTPRERFIQHIAGHKSSRFVRRLGSQLRFDLYGELAHVKSPVESRRLEQTVGADLETRGFHVHGAH